MRDHYDCFGKYLTDWFNDKKVPKGKMSKYNLIYLREYKDILAEYKKYSAMLFFILAAMKVDAEKEARKLAKKAANDEVKEIRKNNEKYRKEYMRLERSFNRYYAGK